MRCMTKEHGGDCPLERPRGQYAKSGDVNIAYQVTGDGPFDLVFVPGYVSSPVGDARTGALMDE